MRYKYLGSFDRSLSALNAPARAKVIEAVGNLIDFFDSGVRTEGLGLKKLRKSYWEIRAGLKTRIIFTLEGDIVSFIVAGSHDEIRRFLRQ